MSFSIDISQAVTKRLKSLPAIFTTAAVAANREAADRIMVFLTRRSRGMRIADTGRYIRGWQMKETADASAAGGRRFEIYNDTPYAAVIEHGRRPGAKRPPIAPIQAWAGRKLGDSSRSTAFVIARAIGRKGIKGKQVVGGAQSRIAKLAVVTFRQSFTRRVRALRGKR